MHKRQCWELAGLSRPLKRASRSLALVLTFPLAAACSGNQAPEEPNEANPSEPESAEERAAAAQEASLDTVLEVPPVNKSSLREHDAGRAWVLDAEGGPKAIEIAQAEARGYTVVDLSDSWRPYIFSEKTPGLEDATDNTYAARYVDLANDRTDRDGDPLADHEHNFLELYGIPPTLSVIRDEWARAQELETCLAEANWDPSAFEGHPGNIAFSKKAGPKRLKQRRWAKGTLDKAMRKARIEAGDYDAAAENSDTRAAHRRWSELDAEVRLIENAQKRLSCEKLYDAKEGRGRSQAGNFDGPTHHALAAFEKKHNIMGWGHFTAANVEALGRSPSESAHARLLRVVQARVVSGAGILEDGSAADWKPDFEWTDAEGKPHKLRNLTGEFSEAAVAALDMQSPESARASLDRLAGLDPSEFAGLLVAIKLPDKPAYYSENMAFSAEIDRGDVWYDFPWDEEGNRRGQPRKRFPKLTLWTEYEGQKIPLVHWRTTIGSWRSEEEDGQEWFAYKNSDVGERVWKDIMAAPVWIPPASTPSRTLLKRKYSRGQVRKVVNYDETGPSYTSAYGLVAAYHIKQVRRKDGTLVELDNQIRTHGSVDYMSILRRYSHGCHRLYNMNAVRMFSFILRHREYTRHGQKEIGFRRAFEVEGKSYRMALDTRGYQYELVEPIKVDVREGRIRGSRRSPYTELMPKPGVEYAPADADAPIDETAELGTSLPADTP